MSESSQNARKETTIELMREVQQDERAFALLTERLFSGAHLTYGKLLERDGDPRLWPEYADAN
jgi:hypothetical protein